MLVGRFNACSSLISIVTLTTAFQCSRCFQTRFFTRPCLMQLKKSVVQTNEATPYAVLHFITWPQNSILCHSLLHDNLAAKHQICDPIISTSDWVEVMWYTQIKFKSHPVIQSSCPVQWSSPQSSPAIRYDPSFVGWPACRVKFITLICTI